ncbi:TetR/AcrR family transcriptional regulator [Arthrobacter sp. zg-Y1143]|uniref:TetR/AcrR family transcriptional regulator n=1 Tax=Arthrobacter sp. zg-Y1143 TaxID=3049065 RepID=UPI0024C2864B|nr:TetR/AcrR family transcriptional regulator [Arthrobacter sp. zg-Y1143]MDK1328836.1 TetR/AcrR family transcriptional regulator [Arthrobacter sp. zg-Y1143]
MTSSTSPQSGEGPRAMARRLHTARILDAAEQQLAEGGPANLSLRAIARGQGMASSAIYRYFASADELLTALILRAYSDLGDAAERAASNAAPGEKGFMAVCHAVRDWALAQPHRYALIYGSPVPDYHAPESTVEQAARVPVALLRLLPPASGQAGANGLDLLDPGLVALAEGIGADPRQLPAGVAVWSQLFGLVNFELFGHFRNVVAAQRSFFDDTLRAAYRRMNG